MLLTMHNVDVRTPTVSTTGPPVETAAIFLGTKAIQVETFS